MRATFAALTAAVFLLACGCTPDSTEPAKGHPATASKVAGTPTKKDEVPLSKAASCTKAHAALDAIRTPLDLLKHGGTPVSFTDDLRTAQTRFATLGAATPAPVGTFEAGLGTDLDRLTTALDAGQTSTVHAVADVISGRINQLTYQCHW